MAAEKALANPGILSGLIEGVGAEEARVKFGSAKALLILSEMAPAKLSRQVDFFEELLDSENKIFVWTAIRILGNLAARIKGVRLKRIVKGLYRFVSAGKLIAANNAIAALGKIASAMPSLRKEILRELMKVER